MLHYHSEEFSGKANDARARGAETGRVQEVMENIYLERMRAKNPATTIEDVQKILVVDTFMDAQRAIKIGLADGYALRAQPRRLRREPPPPKGPTKPQTPE